jgi:hypothetical protein
MKTVTAEGLITFAAREMRKQFDKHGQVNPMWHYITDNGEQGIFEPPSLLHNKDEWVAFAKSVFETERAVAYVFMIEAWTLQQAFQTKTFNAMAVLSMHPTAKRLCF